MNVLVGVGVRVLVEVGVSVPTGVYCGKSVHLARVPTYMENGQVNYW